jgi:phosphoribosyl-ATP pyrophosphohydrolase
MIGRRLILSEGTMRGDSGIVDELYAVIASRMGADPEKSYTAKLFAKGRGKIAQKMGEEAVETVVAALSEGKAQVVAESADMLYHLLVLWADCGVEPTQVWTELARRAGTSGVDEKKQRGKK